MTISISHKLQDLNLSYPFYLFDPDQSPWPRKLSSIPPGSRPAKLSGFLPWGWEYGTTLYRIDDPIPRGVVDTRKREWNRLGDISRILKTLRYDDRFGEETFEVVFEGGGGEQAGGLERRDFRDWWSGEPTGGKGFADERRVVKIVRKWDGVPFWDKEDCWNLLDEGQGETYRCFGVATLVRDEKELIAAAGTKRTTGEKIRKAEIELLDGEGEAVKGVIFPDRFQDQHGLSLRGGPTSVWNRELLMGTALENAPWSKVEDYINRKRNGPLWL